MSLKKNSVANYVGTIYTAIIGIGILPLYLAELGTEAFGLVGLFTLMQAWFNLLDFGLTSALSREIAFTRGSRSNFWGIKKLLKHIELILAFIASLLVAIVYVSSDWIATSWMKIEYLDLQLAINSIMLMGVIFGLRLFTSLYRSAINSMEHQVWLNASLVTMLSIRFVGAWLCLHFLNFDIVDFFQYQLVISCIELFLLAFYFYRIMPLIHEDDIATPSVIPIKSIMPYALSIAYTSLLWIVITHIDKVVLSNALSLSDFAYFSLVIILSAGVIQLSTPISEAILPRLTVLYAQKNVEDFLLVYRWATQVVTAITLTVSLMVALFSPQLLFAWTGDKQVAEWGGTVLIWFVLGNGILAISTFQYYLQRAYGDMRLHIVGATISAIIQVPIIYYSAVHYGAYGVAVSWFCVRLLWFLGWTAIVHNKFLPGFHLTWIMKDIAPIALTSCAIVFIFSYFINVSLEESRLSIFIQLCLLGLCALTVVAFSSSLLRQHFMNLMNKRFNY
jgi:O-antigen/teichoic acid export membrane protein